MAQKTESIIIPLKFTADTGEFLKNVSQMETYLKNLFDSGKLGEEGYLQIRYISAGKDKWFDGKDFIPYKYTNIQFLKFVKILDEEYKLIVD